MREGERTGLVVMGTDYGWIAKPGRWIGAKVGLFALGKQPAAEFGYADYDWFKVE